MDRETKQQLDEWHVEREITDAREARLSAIVDMLKGPHDDCDCHAFYRAEALVLGKRHLLLTRLAGLPLPGDDWDTCEHWAIERADDEAEALDEAAADEEAVKELCCWVLLFGDELL